MPAPDRTLTAWLARALRPLRELVGKSTPPLERLAEIEARLDSLERVIPPAVSQAIAQRRRRPIPPAVWKMAVAMQDAGASLAEIAHAIEAATGARAPAVSSLSSKLKPWRPRPAHETAPPRGPQPIQSTRPRARSRHGAPTRS